MPRAIVIRTAGTNCDGEMVRGFTLAGAGVDRVHLDALIESPARLDDADLIGFPGGFSYGDDIASGRIKAMYLRERLYPELRAAIERGCAVLGVCNGFQVMVQVGLLPGPGPGEPWPSRPPERTLSLADNADARFHDRWVRVAYERAGGTGVAGCVWTRGLDDLPDDARLLPVAHGEGRLVALNERVLDAVESRGQAPLRYAEPLNGSSRSIAGVCDATGRVFGLMPHPDRFLEWNRHPYWTRLPESLRRTPAPGLRMFASAVEAVARMPA